MCVSGRILLSPIDSYIYSKLNIILRETRIILLKLNSYKIKH